MLKVDPDLIRYLQRADVRAETLRKKQQYDIRVAQPQKTLGYKRFHSLVEGVSIVLRTGHPTLFQFEGACRHGLRRVLVEQEWSWRDADAASAAVVSAALDRISAKRPTWLEGQAKYTANLEIDRCYCERCGKLLGEDRKSYCSKLCSNAAYKEKAAKFQTQVSRAEYQAALAERRLAKLKECDKQCDACGKRFIASRPGTRYCSRKCGSSERVKYPPRACDGCGTLFQSKNGMPARFCSQNCRLNAVRVPRPKSSCPSCNSIFTWKKATKPQVYCSSTCNPRNPAAARTMLKCEEVG